MIGEAISGRHLVLTGVTGFLGKVWLVMLLDRFPSVGRVTLFVRGGIERFERIADTSPCFRPLRERHGASLGRFLGARLHIVDADLTKPNCGLPDSERSALSTADLFLHCAGITDFDPDPKKALATNTEGAARVAELAEKAGAPMVHVSTCYVAGMSDGRISESLDVGVSPNGTRFDPEQALVDAYAKLHTPRRSDRVDRGTELAKSMGWPNIYTWSKGLGEHLLAARPDLKLTIARPSIVECARSFPFEGWNEGLNTAGPLAWLISTAFRRLPAAEEHRFDIIPVDDVARGLMLTCAAALRGDAPPVVQLASSDINPLTFGRTIELTGLALRRFVRKGGGTKRERRWFRHLDPVAGSGGWLLPFSMRDWLDPARDTLDDVLERELPEWVSSRARSLKTSLDRMSSDVDRVDGMLELYEPFIQTYDWTFETTAIRGLNDGLPDSEVDFAFDVTQICWRHYWIDVEYPGLMTYCIPILRGQTAPLDRPSNPPLRLTQSQQVASK